MDRKWLHDLIVPAETKIVMIIMDGLGGLAREPGGLTELETAHTPHLDALAAQSTLGLTVPVGPGITPGSGPGHLAVFGYDPLVYDIGRGAMEALGVDFELGPHDVAARGNFCCVDADGVLTDRRGGQVPNELALELAGLLRTIQIDGAEFFVETVLGHRFAFVMRGTGLGAALSDTDPHKAGVHPLTVRALQPDSELAASVANQFIAQARRLLATQPSANMILLRGFAGYPNLPSMQETFGLHAAAIAVNGMYRGVARLLGMTVLPLEGKTLADEFAALEKYWPEFDFFYVHVKQTDSAAQKSDFAGKVRAIEEVDALVPRMMALRPDVVVVGGDHSTPAVMGTHSWHPVPTLLYSPHVRAGGIAAFGEQACARGGLGQLPAKDLMPIVLANARRISKFGP